MWHVSPQKHISTNYTSHTKYVLVKYLRVLCEYAWSNLCETKQQRNLVCCIHTWHLSANEDNVHMGDKMRPCCKPWWTSSDLQLHITIWATCTTPWLNSMSTNMLVASPLLRTYTPETQFIHLKTNRPYGFNRLFSNNNIAKCKIQRPDQLWRSNTNMCKHISSHTNIITHRL